MQSNDYAAVMESTSPRPPESTSPASSCRISPRSRAQSHLTWIAPYHDDTGAVITHGKSRSRGIQGSDDCGTTGITVENSGLELRRIQRRHQQAPRVRRFHRSIWLSHPDRAHRGEVRSSSRMDKCIQPCGYLSDYTRRRGIDA